MPTMELTEPKQIPSQADSSPEESGKIKKIDSLVLSSASFPFFCIEVLKFDWAAHHQKWAELLKVENRLLIECARDHGKSYAFSYAYPLWEATFRKGVSICLISYSQDQATVLSNRIKTTIEQNPFFGGLLPTNRMVDWTKTQMVLANNSSIRSESFGSSIRGGHYDFIIVDDPSKDFGAMNKEDQRNFFYGVILPALNPNGQLIVVGTPIDFGDLLEELEHNREFNTYKFPALSGDKALWPKRYPAEALTKRKREIGSWLFGREYLLERVSPDTAPLRKEWLKYWDKLPEKCNVFMAVDPAISQEGSADYTGIVIGAVDYANNTYLLETIKQRFLPLALIDRIFSLYAAYKPQVIGLETVAFQKILQYWIQDEARKRGVYLPIKEIRTSGRTKDQRIMGIQPRLEAGKLFIRPSMAEFIDEVVKFRLDADGSDDLLDATAMLNEIVWLPPAEIKDQYKGLPLLEQRVWKEVNNRGKNTHKTVDNVLGSEF